MRYLALITAVNAVFVATLISAINLVRGIPFSLLPVVLSTGVIVMIGLAVGLTIGLAAVLLVRRIASGALWPLMIAGIVIGTTTGWLLDVPGQRLWLIGLALGVFSGFQWWFFVERHPERRASFG